MANRIRFLAILAMTTSVLAAAPARAERARRPSLQERIDELQERLDELSARVGTTLAPEVGTASEAARRAEERIAVLEERIADLSEELRAVQDDADAVEERVDAQRDRVDALEGETEGLSDRERERAASPPVEWTAERGLVLRPPPGEGLEVILRGFVLGRYEGLLRDEPGEEWSYGSEFSVPETRLRVETRLLEGLVGVAVEPSFSDGAGRIQDGYLEIAPLDAFRLRLGQMRVPFDREWELLRTAQPFDERSELARSYGHGRDLGVSAGGTLAHGLLTYGLGLFNGAGAGVRNDNYDMLVALRLRYDILGAAANRWSDLEQSTSPRLSIGLGFSFDLADTEADDGSGRHYNRAEYQLTADGLVQWYGAHVAAAVHYRASDHGAAGEIVHAYGYLLEAGYVAWRERLEILVRYLALDPNVDGIDDHGREVVAGLSFFLLGYSARLSLLYAYLFRMPGREPDELRRDGHAIRLQGQVGF